MLVRPHLVGRGCLALLLWVRVFSSLLLSSGCSRLYLGLDSLLWLAEACCWVWKHLTEGVTLRHDSCLVSPD